MKKQIAISTLSTGRHKSLVTLVPASVRNWMRLSAGQRLRWFVNSGERITVEVVDGSEEGSES